MKMTKKKTVFAGILTVVLLVGLYGIVSFTTRATVQVPGIYVQSSKVLQNTSADITLDGFMADETVTLWQTFPDYRVLPLQDVETDSAGRAHVSIPMDASLPVGTHILSARGNTSQFFVTSNVEITAPKPPAQHASLSVVSAGGKQGSPYTFRGTGYQSSEPVSLWVTRSDGSVQDLDIVGANQGDFAFTYIPGSDDPEGTYQITAFGRSSERTAIAAFTVQRGDFVAPTEPASLEVNPLNAKQLDVVVITGKNFSAGEVIGLWITMSNGVVVPLYEGVTTTGAFQERIFLPSVIPEDGLAVGRLDFTAYGKTSNRRAITSLSLAAGNGLIITQQ